MGGDGQHRKRCLLGMPSLGEMSTGAARAFYHATRGGIAVRRHNEDGTLPTSNMNECWKEALNECRRGRGPDLFAMLHSDVQAEDFWLDSLEAEREARGLDVLSAVVPIKDRFGKTSTALGRLDGYPWRPHARLTMSEVYRLPETFTGEDVGFPLLVNTGLMVCKFDEEWAKLVHFSVNDRIVLDEAKNEYVAECEPDDWFFSRRLHDLGLKVGATRKVAVGHKGCALFENRSPWGEWHYDRAMVTESPLPGSSWFPEDVAGWLTHAEGAELARLADGKAVLEIGAYCGRSTVCLAKNAKVVYTVDPFDGRSTGLDGDTLATFRANVRRYGVADRVHAIKGTSSEAVPGMPPIFDVVFIDGAHDHESVREDIGLALSVLRPGGLLAFHDYRRHPGEADGRWDPGVTKAVDELLSGGADLLRRADSLAVVRPAAAGVPSGG